MVQLSWGRKQAVDYADLLERIPNSALDSPRRSVVPLVDYWRNPEPRLIELGAALGFPLLGSAQLAFEYPVPVRKGRGNSSLTDLMILTTDAAIAIEAKYTEPEYESVRTWLRGEHEGNRSDVLDGWLDLISHATASPLTRESVIEFPYQLVHRTASACFSSRSRTALVYLVFGDDPAPHYRKQLSRFDETLAPPPTISFHLLSCRLTGSDKHIDQITRWKRGDREFGDEIRAALMEGPLFTFASLKDDYSRSVKE